MFTVTPSAARELLAAAQRSAAGDLALRVAARQHPDGRLEYGMGFDEFREEDEATEAHGLRLLVGAPSRALLADTQLDFVEIEPGRHDFVFAAANAESADEPAPAAPAGKACGSGGCNRCGG